jgi:hypothetical protein
VDGTAAGEIQGKVVVDRMGMSRTKHTSGRFGFPVFAFGPHQLNMRRQTSREFPGFAEVPPQKAGPVVSLRSRAMISPSTAAPATR